MNKESFDRIEEENNIQANASSPESSGSTEENTLLAEVSNQDSKNNSNGSDYWEENGYEASDEVSLIKTESDPSAVWAKTKVNYDEEPLIRVNHLSKFFGKNIAGTKKLIERGKHKDEIYRKTGVTVGLHDVNLDVYKNELFVVIGLSGSGKSTLIRCFNLLNKPSEGNITYEGKDITKLSKKDLIDFRRNKISMVFQSFGLMSHRNIIDNVAFGLEVKGEDKEARYAKAKEVLSMVGLGGLEFDPISSLSGGMKQRVGLARALASETEVLLMDEPFSALDPLVRKDLQFELASIQNKLGKTIIFITHDIDEAFKLGDRVAIMRDGVVEQVDTPEDMAANPANEYIANFIHSADKSKVLTVKSIMTPPRCIVKDTDNPAFCIREMRDYLTSSAFVINDNMQLSGLIFITEALKAHQAKARTIQNYVMSELVTVNQDDILSDIMTLSTETPYPLVVVDEESRVQGILTKSSVLASMI